MAKAAKPIKTKRLKAVSTSTLPFSLRNEVNAVFINIFLFLGTGQCGYIIDQNR
ncbi:MAG: hypothetical protein PHO08_01995 [Methylococcales bacterium]|nr:hypothetical protein [Methylococcales bacterium]MDD5630672.1 hypothetical protein [Methylococcales bacterium]